MIGFIKIAQRRHRDASKLKIHRYCINLCNAEHVYNCSNNKREETFLVLNLCYTEAIMPLKLHRGINTGTTLRKNVTDWSYGSSVSMEGVFTVTAPDFRQTKFSFEGSDFHRGVYYSIGKKKRWLLAPVLRDHLEDPHGPFVQHRVELVELRNTWSSKQAAHAVSLKEAGQEQSVRRLTARRPGAFLNRRSATWNFQRGEGQLTVNILEASRWSDQLLTTQCRQWREPHKKSKQQHFDDAVFEVDETPDDETGAQCEEFDFQPCSARGARLEDFLRNSCFARGKCRRRRDQKPTEIRSHKDRKIFEISPQAAEEEEPEASRLRDDTVAMVPLLATFPSEETEPARLRADFGENYAEGDSEPRRFAIRLYIEGHAYLIFEEVSSNGPFKQCQVFLNADIENVDQLELDFDVPNSGDLVEFVTACTHRIIQCFAGQFVQSETMRVVCFSKRPQPLRLTHPQLLSVPLPSWPSAEQNNKDKEEKEVKMEEKEELVSYCLICFDELTYGCRLLQCNHIFCNECWRRHVVFSLRRGLTSLLCPASNCCKPLSAVTALRFASLRLLAPHWRALQVSQMARDPYMVPCRKCDRFILVARPPSVGTALNVRCVCSHVFCFGCREEAHWPASCDVYRVFKAKLHHLGDWRLENYIADDLVVQGQRCPSCARFIEKNGGCPSMICVCKANFCWMCSRLMSEGSHSNCYREHMNNKSPDGLQSIKLFSAVPSPTRSQCYCTALEWRMGRLIGFKRAHLNVRDVKVAILDGNCNRTRFHKTDYEQTTAFRYCFQELQRAIEFCLSAASILPRSRRRKVLLQMAHRLIKLTELMRSASLTKGPCVDRKGIRLRWCSEVAAMEVRLIQMHRMLREQKNLR